MNHRRPPFHTVLALGGLAAFLCAAAACGDDAKFDDDDSTTTAVGTGTSATTAGSGGAASSGSPASNGSGAGATTTVGSGGAGAAGGCYTEAYNRTADLSDLQSGYNQSQWLATMLTTLQRRYDTGFVLMDAMKNDPFLTDNFPTFFDLSTWGGMIGAIDTACHEETHGYDFEQSLSTPGKHLFYIGSNLEVIATKHSGFFARNVMLPEVQQGGSVTSLYDDTYLTGESGTYDFIFLADELNSYINGLACATAVQDHLSSGGHSYRDGAASHLYYLLVYLRIARAQYPTLYQAWKADADWQQFVRYSWARGKFWTAEALPFSNLGIDDAAIWQRINRPEYLDELTQFTGETPDAVACNP